MQPSLCYEAEELNPQINQSQTEFLNPKERVQNVGRAGGKENFV